MRLVISLALFSSAAFLFESLIFLPIGLLVEHSTYGQLLYQLLPELVFLALMAVIVSLARLFGFKSSNISSANVLSLLVFSVVSARVLMLSFLECQFSIFHETELSKFFSLFSENPHPQTTEEMFETVGDDFGSFGSVYDEPYGTTENDSRIVSHLMVFASRVLLTLPLATIIFSRLLPRSENFVSFTGNVKVVKLEIFSRFLSYQSAWKALISPLSGTFSVILGYIGFCFFVLAVLYPENSVEPNTFMQIADPGYVYDFSARLLNGDFLVWSILMFVLTFIWKPMVLVFSVLTRNFWCWVALLSILIPMAFNLAAFSQITEFRSLIESISSGDTLRSVVFVAGFALALISGAVMAAFYTNLAAASPEVAAPLRQKTPSMKHPIQRLNFLAGVPNYMIGASVDSHELVSRFRIGSTLVGLERVLILGVLSTAAFFLVIVATVLPKELWISAFAGFLAAALIFIFAGFIGRRIMRKARIDLTNKYSKLVETDAREPTLYLRGFADDAAVLKPKRHGIIPKLLTESGLPSTIDELIFDRFSWIGPVIAIGQPGEPYPPFGAARKYVSDTENWQTVVKDLSHRSKAIIISLDSTPGIQWEANLLLDEQLSEKSLFLSSPRSTNSECLEQFCLLFPELNGQFSSDVRIIGVSIHGSTKTVFTCADANRESYASAVDIFLHEKSQELEEAFERYS